MGHSITSQSRKSLTHKFLIPVSAAFLTVGRVEGICDQQRGSADFVQLTTTKMTFLLVVEVHCIYNVTFPILDDSPNCTTNHVTRRLSRDAEANTLP